MVGINKDSMVMVKCKYTCIIVIDSNKNIWMKTIFLKGRVVTRIT